MNDFCKYEKEIGGLEAEVRAVTKAVEKLDKTLNNGVKSQLATIAEHCKAHDDLHKGIVWRAAFKAFILLGGAYIIGYCVKMNLS
jgi:hypothetical protein